MVGPLDCRKRRQPLWGLVGDGWVKRQSPGKISAMSLAKKLDNLIQVKTRLSEKYARRAEAARSQPLQKSLWRKSIRYRRQAEVLQNQRRQLG